MAPREHVRRLRHGEPYSHLWRSRTTGWENPYGRCDGLEHIVQPPGEIVRSGRRLDVLHSGEGEAIPIRRGGLVAGVKVAHDPQKPCESDQVFAATCREGSRRLVGLDSSTDRLEAWGGEPNATITDQHETQADAHRVGRHFADDLVGTPGGGRDRMVRHILEESGFAMGAVDAYPKLSPSRHSRSRRSCPTLGLHLDRGAKANLPAPIGCGLEPTNQVTERSRRPRRYRWPLQSQAPRTSGRPGGLHRDRVTSRPVIE